MGGLPLAMPVIVLVAMSVVVLVADSVVFDVVAVDLSWLAQAMAVRTVPVVRRLRI